MISKRNKLWKRFRGSLKIRNISNLYLHCTEQPPQYWCYPPLYWCYPPLYWCYPPLYWRYPPLYWIPSTVLMLSPTVLMLSPHMYWCYPPNVLNTLHSTEAIPHSTDVIPPMYWTTSTVLMLSPTVLKVSPTVLKLSPHMYCCNPPTCTAVIPPHVLLLSPHSTEGIPPQYWRYPSTVLNSLHSTDVNTLHSTDVIAHSTDVIPPHVLMLSPRMYWCYPPLYWTTSTVLKLSPHCTEQPSPHCTEQPPQHWSYPSTVLKLSPHSTEAILPQYWSYPPTALMLSPRCTEQPPMYWTTSTVLNRRYMGWEFNSLKLDIAKYQAGNINNCFSALLNITNDKHILDIVKEGLIIDFRQVPKSNINYNAAKFNNSEINIIDMEVNKLMTKVVIIECSSDLGDFISPVFVRRKKDGTHRIILNLKQLDIYVNCIHFKMETLNDVLRMMRPCAWFAKVDLKNAFIASQFIL